MFKLRNLIVFAAVLTLAIMSLPQVAAAQGLKVGFVKDEDIKAGYKAWSKAQEEWDLESKAWEDEAVAKQDELQEMITEYEKQKLILSEEKKAEKEAAIRVKQESLDAFTRQVFGPNGSAERKHGQLIAPLLENVTNAIEAVAVAENYDVIFTMQSGLGYIRESFDVTDKVLEYLENME